MRFMRRSAGNFFCQEILIQKVLHAAKPEGDRVRDSGLQQLMARSCVCSAHLPRWHWPPRCAGHPGATCAGAAAAPSCPPLLQRSSAPAWPARPSRDRPPACTQPAGTPDAETHSICLPLSPQLPARTATASCGTNTAAPEQYCDGRCAVWRATLGPATAARPLMLRATVYHRGMHRSIQCA